MSAAVASGATIRLRHRPAGLRGLLRAAAADDDERLDRKMGVFDLQSLGGYREFLELNAAARVAA